MANEPVVLNAVGDLCFGDSLINLGFGTRSTMDARGPGYIFDAVRQALQAGDLLFGNLECALSDRGLNWASPTSAYLRGAPHAIDACTHAGFHILNVANNHTLQYGAEAFHDTTRILREHGIAPVGLRATGTYSSEPVVVQRNGIRIGFLGYSHEWEQYFDGQPLYATTAQDGIIADVERLKTIVDYVVVSLHWGLEYMTYPSREMIRLARTLVDHGCDVFLGHHPHVVQGCETYKSAVIAYSLGNFVFDTAWWPTCRRTLILRVTFPPDRHASLAHEVIPVRITQGYQPALVDEATTARELAVHTRLADRIETDRGTRLFTYHRAQRLRLLAIRVAKIVHILRHFRRYAPHVRRHLVVRKLLRLNPRAAVTSQ